MPHNDVREATSEELENWDALVVDVSGGSVHQSRAWARYQAALGWNPHFLVCANDRSVMALTRRWPLLPRSDAYLPRGPVDAGDAAGLVADRLAAVTEYLARKRADVVASDAEIRADSGYGEELRRIGFHSAEEVQPSRHRMGVPISGLDEQAAFSRLNMSARQRVRGAVKQGLHAIRWVIRPDDALPVEGMEVRVLDAADTASIDALSGRLYELVSSTAARRGFALVGRNRFALWMRLALEDGLGTVIEILDSNDATMGGALFHLHGKRLTYFIAGDSEAARGVHPGVTHLLVWRAMQLAVALGYDELDLGGVDVRGARRRPEPGEQMHGVMAFKESFGAEWIELAGNHVRVLNPVGYALGRVSSALGSRLRR